MSLAVFVGHLPGWFLCAGMFLPVSLLLVLLIIHLNLNLQRVEAQLSVVQDPRETARRFCCTTSYQMIHRAHD